MMERILLRTLTEKSTLGGGRYSNQKIETIIDLDKPYLIHSYYIYSKINFTPSVLEKLGITEKYRINKPGKDREMFHQFNIDRINAMTKSERAKYFIKRKRKRIKEAKLMAARHRNDERGILKRGSLARINNGNSKLDLSYRDITK